MREQEEMPEEVKLFLEELEKAVGRKRRVLTFINIFATFMGVAVTSTGLGTASWFVWNFGLVHISELPPLPYWSFLVISLIHASTIYLFADIIKRLKRGEKDD